MRCRKSVQPCKYNTTQIAGRRRADSTIPSKQVTGYKSACIGTFTEFRYKSNMDRQGCDRFHISAIEALHHIEPKEQSLPGLLTFPPTRHVFVPMDIRRIASQPPAPMMCQTASPMNSRWAEIEI